ncbi:MAG: hypothetical protein ACYC2H_08960 [Thermoplasmatota archaeon]
MPLELYDGRGQKLVLGARLGRGGEGEVFEVAGQPGLVAKVLHAKGRTQAKLDKVAAMLANPPAGAHEALEGLPVLTWPRAVVHSRPGGQGVATFVGYTMARIAPRDFVPFYQLTSASRRRGLGGAPITWDRLVLLGMRLCHVVRTLHRFGYAVGDLNDRNVLVSRRLTPLLMDTDSFQVPRPGSAWKGQGHFPSIVGDQQYWPPELLSVDLATHTGSRETGDRFALGVLLFQLFMGGVRPYQARGSAVDGLESVAEKTKAGLYPWASPKKGFLEPPTSAPDYQALPPAIRQAFERCFVAGHKHPGKRPTADDWHAVLAKVHAAGYQACPSQTRHAFAAGLRACPWCADPNDPFDPEPRTGRAPRPAPVLRRPVAVPARPSRTAKRKPVGPPQQPVTVAKTPMPRPTPTRKGRRVLAAAAPAATPRARPAAASRRRPGTKARPRSAPLAQASSRLPARGLWVGGLTLAFASPTAVLASMPAGMEQRATMAVATALLLCVLGWAATARWLPTRRARGAAAWLWLVAATAATLGLVGAGRWSWLVYTTGAACLALGLAAFVWMERGRPGAFSPRGVGLVHGAAGIPVAYLPVLVVWLWGF